MKIIKGLEEFPSGLKNVVLTIGNFDGVHLGHRKILKAVREKADALGGTAVAMTFEPHPMKVLQPDRHLRLITQNDEKARVMKRFGMDAVCFVDFDRAFASIEPDRFIEDVLVGKIGVKELVVGYNYAFGKGKKGTTELLRRRGRKHGFGLKIVRQATLNGDVVSSSRIRSLIAWGRVCEASLYLGRPYMISGEVIKGAGRGARLLGTPTANISTASELMPKEGVYVVKARFDKREYEGVMNIGKNPTFDGAKQSYEVHIFDYNGDMLGKELKVYFIDRIRDEKTFSGVDALKEQIRIDILKAKDILKTKEHLPLI